MRVAKEKKDNCGKKLCDFGRSTWKKEREKRENSKKNPRSSIIANALHSSCFRRQKKSALNKRSLHRNPFEIRVNPFHSTTSPSRRAAPRRTEPHGAGVTWRIHGSNLPERNHEISRVSFSRVTAPDDTRDTNGIRIATRNYRCSFNTRRRRYIRWDWINTNKRINKNKTIYPSFFSRRCLSARPERRIING